MYDPSKYTDNASTGPADNLQIFSIHGSEEIQQLKERMLAVVKMEPIQKAFMVESKKMIVSLSRSKIFGLISKKGSVQIAGSYGFVKTIIKENLLHF